MRTLLQDKLRFQVVSLPWTPGDPAQVEQVVDTFDNRNEAEQDVEERLDQAYSDDRPAIFTIREVFVN